ncbi:polysaccharide deacetylase family protein [Compostibacter hankyongensis]|uniref:Polysaccharide deacetylase family protein n=1 Tax=Compostibacter hankyongensis TaxID=1007089 RepID=A0ABP8FVA3_9BACT
MITIRTNNKCSAEKQYILDVIFTEFLGINFHVRFENKLSGQTIYELPNGKKLINTDIFFEQAESQWLSKRTLPETPLKILSIKDSSLPFKLPFSDISVIYGEPHITFSDPDTIYSKVDFWGSMFFMLSRYEEAISPDKDSHGRFPANASIAYKNNFLCRPIVNEYLELLWKVLQFLDQKLRRKERKFKNVLTCDVDWPYNPVNHNYKLFLKKTAKNIIKDKSIQKTWETAFEFIKVRMYGWKADSYNTFSYLMQLAEKEKMDLVFYFICDHSAAGIDGNYSINDKLISNLISEINQRGHQIGVHFSYNTYLDGKQINKEVGIFKDKLGLLGIKQDITGSRQHYLRYKTSETIAHLNNAGLSYDSTLSFAEHAGFRSGVCYEYSMYDLSKRRKLCIKERPLIAMECSVISKKYMNLGYSEEALKTFQLLKKQCALYQGNFILLWHNSFLRPNDKALLEAIFN